MRKIGQEVFDAASAPLRLKILRFLYSKGNLSYSEIMKQLELNPGKDAGKFAYHLRENVKAGLIRLSKDTKKYSLTALGKMVIKFDKRLEEFARRIYGRLLVRTSNVAIEEFDRTKIVRALTIEAGVPTILAQKIAEETEERLLKLDTLYLTAPLIREFVNTILIEKGLQKYRHRLTRLGLPVYDITRLIKSVKGTSHNVEDIYRITGNKVMREYVLLNILPRNVADAHLSGALHINNLGQWILKPNEFQHDIRFFLQRGLKPSQTGFPILTHNSPKTLNGALSILSAIIDSSRASLVGEQSISHFNVFLSPFAKGLSEEDIKSALKLFLFNLNRKSYLGSSAEVSLGLDFFVPTWLENVKIFETNDKNICYGDYTTEANKILSTLIDLMFEDDAAHPIFNPHIIFNIGPEVMKNKDAETLLLRVHELVAKYGTPYFVNLTKDWQNNVTYFATGTRLALDWTGDWELDVLRTGSLGNIVINLPRLVYDAKGSDSRLFESLNNYIDIVSKALAIEYCEIKKRIDNHLLPLLSTSVGGEPYLRLSNTSSSISFVGLNEAVKAHTGCHFVEDNVTLGFANKLVKHTATRIKEASKSLGFRFVFAQKSNEEAAQRLAEIDSKRYGWSVVSFQGTKEAPYYTDLVAAPLEFEGSLKKRLEIESQFHRLAFGGHLALIELEETVQDPEDILRTTKKICSYDIGMFAFTRSFSYCMDCKRIVGSLLLKCPRCKSVHSLIRYSRSSAKYLPLCDWGSKKMLVTKRMRYTL